MSNDVVRLVRELYPEEGSARTALKAIDVPIFKIRSFQSAETFWTEMIIQLENGIIRDGVDALLRHAAAEYPGRATEIEALRARPQGPRTAPPRVFCLFADPKDNARLRLGQEARVLHDIGGRGGIQLVPLPAARPEDILDAVFNGKPDILHFAGHGGPKGLLFFENEEGRGAPVAARSVADAVRAAGRTLDCVVLNSCFTADNAAVFRGAARAVAGSTGRIQDDCAVSFARGFYTAIAAGSITRKAFDAGVAMMDMRLCDSSGMRFESFPGTPAV